MLKRNLDLQHYALELHYFCALEFQSLIIKPISKAKNHFIFIFQVGLLPHVVRTTQQLEGEFLHVALVN